MHAESARSESPPHPSTAGRRVAFVVGPLVPESGDGARRIDVEALAERFKQDDMGFDVHALDPRQDVAEQVEIVFEGEGEPARSVVFYAFAPGIIDQDDLLLCFDPREPDVGDSFREILSVCLEHAAGPVLAVLELEPRAAGAGAEGEIHAVDVAERARRVARFADRPVELIVAVTRHTEDEPGDGGRASAFTQLLLEKFEDAERSVTARELYKELAADQSALALSAFGYGASTTESLAFLERSAATSDAAEPAATPAVAGADAESAPIADEGSWDIEPGVESQELAPPAPPSEAVLSLSSVPPTTIAPPSLSGDPPEDTTADALPEDQPVAEAAPTAETSTVEPSTSTVDDVTAASVEPVPPEPMGPRPVEAIAPPPPAPPSTPVSELTHMREADAALVTGRYEDALEALRRALGFGNLSREKKGEVYVRMAEAKEALGRHKEAISNLEKALGFVDVEMADVITHDLMRLHFAEGEFREALMTQERLLKSAAGDKEKFEMLVDFGRMWLKQPDERMRARQMLERAWEIDDSNLDLCRVLRDLAEKDDRDDDAVALTKRMCDLEPDTKKRAQRLVRLAGALLDRQRDDEAIACLVQSIDVEVRELSALEMLADVLSERQEWSQLEALYRKVLSKLDVFEASARPDIENEVSRRLGLLLRDHLEDHALALEAFGRAARAKPGESSARKLAIDVAREIGDHVATREHLIALSKVEPTETRVYRLLFETHMRLGATERAVDAASVLVHLGAASDRERVVYQSTKEEAPPRYGNTLTSEDWPLLAEPLDRLGTAGRILALAGPAAAASLSEAAKRKDRGEPIEVGKSTISAVRAFDWSCRTLGVRTPEIVLDDTRDVGFVPGYRAGAPTMSIGRTALRGLGVGELSALSARNAIYGMPSYALLAACSNMEELTIAFIAILRTAMSDLQLSEVLAVRAGLLVPRIEARLDPSERRELAELARAFDSEGGRFELVRYVESAERTGMRAALLSAGDLPSTLKALSDAPAHFAVASPEERERELMTFVVSDELVALRRRLGVELAD